MRWRSAPRGRPGDPANGGWWPEGRARNSNAAGVGCRPGSRAAVEAIREVLEQSDFLGEGRCKVRVRLRSTGIWVGKNRVLRLMWENRMLAGTSRRRAIGGRRSNRSVRE